MRKAFDGLIIIATTVFAVLFSLLVFVNIRYPIIFTDEINHAASTTGVDKWLIISIAKAESGFNVHAESEANAKGIMQLQPKTAQYICDLNGIEYANDHLFIAKKNILMGSLYLKYLQHKFNNQDTVIVAYNAGEGNVAKWLQTPEYSADGVSLKQIPYKETEEYLKKVKSNIQVYKKIWK